MNLKITRLTAILAAVMLIIIGGSIGFFMGAKSVQPPPQAKAPASVPLPAHTSLTRTDAFLLDQTHDWYYTVPQLSEDAITAFYQAQLPHHGWQCVTITSATNMTYYGQQLQGTSVYITATQGKTLLKLLLGDQDYGSFLLGDDLPDDTIALKITNEPLTKTNFTCAS